MTQTVDQDLWAGWDDNTLTGDRPNPFDPNRDPELHAAWQQQTEQEHQAREAARAELAEQRRTAQLAEATQLELTRMRARAAAANILRAETNPAGLPPAVNLKDLLAEPDEPVRYRIDRLWPAGGRVVLAAQFKAGKTTTVSNLLRSLVDGHPFLGKYDTTPPDGNVVLLDTEMGRNNLRHWLRDQNIGNVDRVEVIPMRGKASTFDVLTDQIRDQWAQQLRDRDTATVVLDCLGPVLASLGLDENTNLDMGRFLAGFEQMLTAAGVSEAVIVHHMGHAGERSRGASRLRDWPDAEWKLVRDSDDLTGEAAPDARRYFSALGRDVAENETLLQYDRASRHLTILGGSRREVRNAGAVPAIVEFITQHPGRSGRQIEAALKGVVERDQVRAALKAALIDETICRHQGGTNGTYYYIKGVCGKCAEPRALGFAGNIDRDQPIPQYETPELYENGIEGECAECAGVRGAHSVECAARVYTARTPRTHTDTKTTRALNTPPRELTSCLNCYGPLDDEDGTGVHPECQTP